MTRARGSRLLWTPIQLNIVIALLIGIVIYLGVRLALNPAFVSDPQPFVPARGAELEDRIDPNTAAWHEIAALPGIGERKAKDIVEYREAFVVANPNRAAFQEAKDLLRIRGVGPAMLAAIEPYLVFPSQDRRPASTQSNAD